MMAEQTEMQPSVLLFQIDTLRYTLFHNSVLLGNIQAGATPFPVSEREFYTHKFRIS